MTFKEFTSWDTGRNIEHRSWMIICNNPKLNDLLSIEALSYKYLIIGFEHFEIKTPHLQCYVNLKQAMSFNDIKVLLPRCHFHRPDGTAWQNRGYIVNKTDEPDLVYNEFGKIPEPGKRSDIEDFCKAVSSGVSDADLAKQYPRQFMLYKSKMRCLRTQSDGETEFLILDPIHDMITEIVDNEVYKGRNIIFVTELSQIEAYEAPYDVVVFDTRDNDVPKQAPLWPRGIPILYKYGYEYIKLRCKVFILVVHEHYIKLYPAYKKLISY